MSKSPITPVSTCKYDGYTCNDYGTNCAFCYRNPSNKRYKYCPLIKGDCTENECAFFDSQCLIVAYLREKIKEESED